eukprot:13804644-Alexandrium_andersonii.AAC.1
MPFRLRSRGGALVDEVGGPSRMGDVEKSLLLDLVVPELHGLEVGAAGGPLDERSPWGAADRTARPCVRP